MKLLVTAPYNEQCLEELKEAFGEVVYKSWKENGTGFNEEQVRTMLGQVKPDAYINELDEVTERVINEFPNLKFIGVCRAVPANVDVKAATAKNIPIFCTPARNAQAVAEMFISCLLAFMRKVVKGYNWLEERNWTKESFNPYFEFKGNELAGKTVGFVGFGAVGQRIANIIKHFPCKILYYDPFVKFDNGEFVSVPLEKVFEVSDIVTIHLPVLPTTKGLITGELMSKMKSSAILVNYARAVVVNRGALMEILKNNKIKGAVLDVFDSEPPDEVDYELINLPNVLATPHLAGATVEVEDHHSRIMNSNVLSWVADKEVVNTYNKKALIELSQK
jgi:D-3-phosphoglycerate dehydrogenase